MVVLAKRVDIALGSRPDIADTVEAAESISRVSAVEKSLLITALLIQNGIASWLSDRQSKNFA